MSVIKKRECYKQVGDTKLNLYLFEPSERKHDELLPSIVFFPGGGWTFARPEQFFPHCNYFSTRGMVSISAEYRVKNKHGTSPLESVLDGKSVIRWIRDHSSHLGINPQKIIGAGGSAGGHVALCTALTKGYESDSSKGNPLDSKPNALVLFNPVVDTVTNPRIANLFKGKAREFSPIHLAKKGAPPTLIFHGTRDNIVPFKDVEQFTIIMKELGIRCELVSFEGKGHAFFNYGRDKNIPYKETVRAADKFLLSLDLLNGKSTI